MHSNNLRKGRAQRGHFNLTGLLALVALLFCFGLLIAGGITGRTLALVLAFVHLALAALFGYFHKRKATLSE